MNTEHKGKAIQFDSAREVWVCGDLGLEDASLKKLKGAIERETKKERTVRVPALYLRDKYIDRDGEWEYVPVLSEVTITLIMERGTKARIETPPKTKSGKPEKDEASLSEIYPVEQRARIEAYLVAEREEFDARRKAESAKEELKHVDAAWVREQAVRHAEENAP